MEIIYLVFINSFRISFDSLESVNSPGSPSFRSILSILPIFLFLAFFSFRLQQPVSKNFRKCESCSLRIFLKMKTICNTNI